MTDRDKLIETEFQGQPTGGVIVWLVAVWAIALIGLAYYLGGHIDEIFSHLP